MEQNSEIFVGPWIGEFGHWLMHVTAYINGIRYDNPDAKIVVSSFADDYLYLRDLEGNPTFDEYIPLEWWPGDRGNAECKASTSKQAQDTFAKFHTQADHRDIFNIPFPQYQKMVKEADTRLYYRFGAYLQRQPSDHIVVMPRAKNYRRDWYRSWLPDYWRHFIGEISKHVKVYVGGIAQESVQGFYSDNIVELSKLPNRAEKTIEILNNAICCVADCCGGSQIAVQTGCPTIVHGPDNIKQIYDTDKPSKNFFGTFVEYHPWYGCSDALTLSERLNDVLEFIVKAKALTRRCEKDELLILSN
ncbi:MAG: hypothetical protein ACXABY_15870 [Candidatus Thorarchaeota archaeon]|jgi:hypothetical protein